MSTSAKKIGFIGLGVMGASMAGHLRAAGHSLGVYNRTKAKAKALIDAGAIWYDSVAELAAQSDFIFTMVGFPAEVEELYFGEKGLIASARPGTILIDTTTSSPALSKRISETAILHGLDALDAPVSGGDLGARNASLTIMVGGDQDVFNQVKPLLDLLGKTVVLQGNAGAGQHTKLANQIAIAGSLLGAVEAIRYAQANSLDPRTVLQSIGAGSAGSWQLLNMIPRALDGDFEPGFYAKHFLKDLRLALDSAKAEKLDLPLLDLAERLFSSIEFGGLGDKGTQILYQWYKDHASALLK